MIKIIKKDYIIGKNNDFDIIFTDQIIESKKSIKISNPKDLYNNLKKIKVKGFILLQLL